MLFGGVDSVVSEHQRPRGRLRFYCRRCTGGNFAFSHAHHTLSVVRSTWPTFCTSPSPVPNRVQSAAIRTIILASDGDCLFRAVSALMFLVTCSRSEYATRLTRPRPPCYPFARNIDLSRCVPCPTKRMAISRSEASPMPHETGEISARPKAGAGFESRIRHAYFWTVVGSTARYGAGFVISLVLAHLLTPSDYGLIGMMAVFTELLASVFDWSIGPAVVHFYEDGKANEIPQYFTFSFLLGMAFTLLLIFSAPLIADFYHEPRLVLLLRVMSVNLVIGSIRAVSGSVLVRQLRFRGLSFAEVGASLAAGVVAVAMAFLGFGVWSLIANLFILNILQAVAYGWFVPPRFAFTLHRDFLKRLARYCAPLTGSGFLGKFYDNADYLIVGRVLGPVALGFYALAFRLSMLVNERISSVLNRAAFPTFAIFKHDIPKTIDHWFALTKRVTLITFPLLVWLVVNAQDMVRLLLGDRWTPAAVPLQFLCVMTAAKILTNIVNQLMSAIGHPEISVRYDVVTAIVLPTAFYIGCKRAGLAGIGIAWCTVFPCLRLLYLIAFQRVLHFRFRDYGRALFDSAWVSALCAGVMLPVAFIVPAGWWRLAIRSTLCAVAFSSSVLLNRNLRALFLDTFAMRFGSALRGKSEGAPLQSSGEEAQPR
jgi:teichuronic acid exporter